MLPIIQKKKNIIQACIISSGLTLYRKPNKASKPRSKDYHGMHACIYTVYIQHPHKLVHYELAIFMHAGKNSLCVRKAVMFSSKGKNVCHAVECEGCSSWWHCTCAGVNFKTCSTKAELVCKHCQKYKWHSCNYCIRYL